MTPLPPAVLQAFGVGGVPRALPGGQGTSVFVAGLVLKPNADVEETTWWAELCARVQPDRVRIPAPVRSAQGQLVVAGWSATLFVDGSTVSEDERSAHPWTLVLQAGRALHHALADEQRPSFLGRRADRWSSADRFAWDEEPCALGERSTGMLTQLRPHVVNEGLQSQLIHGDLSGNVLLSEDVVPAVIDIAPYWRPRAYADAIVVIDAMLWWQAEPALMTIGRPDGLDLRLWQSLLVRAFRFRLAAFGEGTRTPSRVGDAELDRYERLMRTIDQLSR